MAMQYLKDVVVLSHFVAYVLFVAPFTPRLSSIFGRVRDRAPTFV